MNKPDDTKLNLSAGAASALVAVTLVALKLWALGETQALSVAASLADSAMDLMVSLGALAAIWYASRPADEDHAFGHSSAEDLAALGQSLFILVSAGVIAWAAVARLLSGEPAPIMSHESGIFVMAVSIVLTLALVLWQRHVATRTGSAVVKADSLHYLATSSPISARSCRCGLLPGSGWSRSTVSSPSAPRSCWPWVHSASSRPHGTR